MHVLITSIIDLEKTSYSRLHRFIEHLLSSGHKVEVISIRDSWKHKGIRQNQALVKRLRIHHLTKRDIGLMRQKVGAAFAPSRILRGVDLDKVDVHLSYNSLVLSNLLIPRLERHGIKTVYDLADDLPDMIRTSPQIPSFLRQFAGMVGGYLLKRSLRNAAAVTYSAREFVQSMGLSESKAVYVPNGVDVERFKPRKSPHKGIVVGYVGALREWVDLRPMLSAVRNLKGYRMKVLVVGGEEDLARYQDFVRENSMERIVTFTGNVPYDEVPRHINMMDITTMPFKKNRVTDGTCPLKLLEYLACEKPAIVSPLNEVRSMLRDRVLYASTVKEWEKQLSTLYHDGILRETLGRQGRSHVVEHFSWDRICLTMEQTLMEHHRQRREN